MSRNEKKGHGGKHTRPKKWSGARRPVGPATTALIMVKQVDQNIVSTFCTVQHSKVQV